MSFCDQWSLMTDRQRSRFAEIVGRLLGGKFVMPEGPLSFDTDWQFVVRHRQAIDDWLSLARFALVLDEQRQLATVAHRDGRHRWNFDKFTSLVLCQLRLMYHLAMTREGEGIDAVTVTVGELREGLIQAGYNKRIPASRLRPCLLDLRRADLVHFESRGFFADDGDTFVISVAIERALPPAKVQEIRDRLREYLVASDASERAMLPQPSADSGRTESGPDEPVQLDESAEL